MNQVYVDCPNCYGWGVADISMLSQWEEDDGESLVLCDYCDGVGYIPFEGEGEEVVVQRRDNSRSDATVSTCRCDCDRSCKAKG